MSIFGKILADVVEGVIDTAEIAKAVTVDVVCSPFVFLDNLNAGHKAYDYDEHTQEVIQNIKEEDTK